MLTLTSRSRRTKIMGIVPLKQWNVFDPQIWLQTYCRWTRNSPCQPGILWAFQRCAQHQSASYWASQRAITWLQVFDIWSSTLGCLGCRCRSLLMAVGPPAGAGGLGLKEASRHEVGKGGSGREINSSLPIFLKWTSRCNNKWFLHHREREETWGKRGWGS